MSESNQLTPRGLFKPARNMMVGALLLRAMAAISAFTPIYVLVQLAQFSASDAKPQTLQMGQLIVLTVLGFGLWLAGSAISYHLTHLADCAVSLELRHRLVAHIERLPLDWLRRVGVAKISSAIDGDIGALHQLIGHTPNDFVEIVVMPLCAFSYLLWLNWAIALLALLPALVAFLAFRQVTSSRNAIITDQRNQAMAEMAGANYEFAHQISTLKLFPNELGATKRFSAAISSFESIFIVWVLKIGKWGAIAGVVLSPAITMFWGVLLASLAIVVKAMTPAEGVGLVLLIRSISGPVEAMGHGFDAYLSAMSAVERINELLSARTLPMAAELKEVGGNTVRFEGVSFAYARSTILKNVNLELTPGSTTALVGPSGAGKSTLAALVPRFMDVDSGVVTIGGADVRTIDPQMLNRKVAFVFQNPRLLRLSIAQNIALNRSSASMEQIRAAAESACIHEKIESLEKGYAAIPGEDAVLSGGEVQRIAIARVLLADAPIVLLDEATSATDPATELAVRFAMSRLMKNRTILVISHRLKSICDADQILVLDHGEIVERGQHKDLIKKKGAYYRMWQREMQSVSEEDSW